MSEDLLSKLDNSYTLRLLEEMISINSIVGQEGEMAEYLMGELSSLGLKKEIHEVEHDRPNIYARLVGEGPGRRLNFYGHTDTVPVVEGWETDPFTPVRKGTRLYGLGACDMKAGIACTLNMIRAFVESGYRFRGSYPSLGSSTRRPTARERGR